ncbi:nucleoside deaminase [Segetibacter sp. 3557_3]|nr:nucleoside deaminase [Segetibacter sp. 3557_3]
MDNDEVWMTHALRQAEEAFDQGEVPVGAVLVINHKIVAKGHNQVEQLKDPTAHAEVLAITSACSYLGAKYLPNATLFVTVEPCHMCAGALYWSKLNRVVYGTADVKNGYRNFCGTNNPFHPKTAVIGGILADECAKLMKDFFKARR